MPNSLLTGVSGMLAHQRLLDIVGHNIANANTTGYKAQRALFSDLFYETINPATGGGDGESGGVNPNQIGGGVKLAMTDRKFGQGGLESTGEQFDVAISGGGFFVVEDGTGSSFLTRAGMFSVDANDILVAPGGMKVQRVAGAGEPGADGFGFQIPGDSSIRIPLGTPIPGIETTEISLTGNLDSNSTGDQAEIRFSNPYQTGDPPVPATASTLLSDLNSGSGTFSGTDEIYIKGTDTDGDPIGNRIVPIGAATTLGDIVSEINIAFPGVTAAVNAAGGIEVTANETGDTDFSIKLENAPGNGFEIDFTSHLIDTVRQVGKAADIVLQTVSVYDERGGRHEVGLEFEKLTDDSWRMTASIDPIDGVVTDSTIDEIIFNDDGSLRGTSDSQILLQLNGFDQPLLLDFSFEDTQTGLGLNHRPTRSNLAPTQDGAAPGSLMSVNIDSDGFVKGIASNGRTFTIAQLAIASVSNPKGLSAVGENLFQTSLNSGEPEIGLAGAGDRGMLVGGQLESSNVDLAYEFTRLIVAQRGFSANARTITVSDEVLEELTNIIR